MNIYIEQGDITTYDVDVIVNAANTSLLGGSGVDGAIHSSGGPEILEECRQIRNRQGGCDVGEAVITTAGNLPAKKVIHTVGPKWNGGDFGEEINLENCYINSLQLADQHGFHRIAFPNISTGIYSFPKPLAANIAMEAVRDFQSRHLTDVFFVCFDEENYELYIEL